MDKLETIGYVRQAAFDFKGEKIEEQINRIKLFAEEHNCNLLQTFVDNGVSGNAFNRQGWDAMKEFLLESSCAVRYVIVTDFMRLARNSDSVAALREELQIMGIKPLVIDWIEKETVNSEGKILVGLLYHITNPPN